MPKRLQTQAIACLLSADPHVAQMALPVRVSHPPYAQWKQQLLEAIKHPTQKAVAYPQTLPPGGQWLLLYPNGRGPGYPVYVRFDKNGVATVVAGAGNALNGVRIYGLKTEQELKELAKKNREETRLNSQHLLELLSPQPDAEDKARFLQQRRRLARLYLEEKHALETETLHHILALLGHKPIALDIPEEIFVSLPYDQQALAQKHNHRENVLWMEALFSQIKSFLLTRLGVATDALWQGQQLLLAHNPWPLEPPSSVDDLAARFQLSLIWAREEAPLWGLTPQNPLPPLPPEVEQALQSVRTKRQNLVSVPELPPETVAALLDAQRDFQAKSLHLQDAFSALFSEKRRRTNRRRFHAEGIPKQALSSSAPTKKELLEKALRLIESVAEPEQALRPVQKLPKSLLFSERDPEPVFATALSAGRLEALMELLSAVHEELIDPYFLDALGALGCARLYVQRWRQILAPQVYQVLERDFEAFRKEKIRWMQESIPPCAQVFLSLLQHAPTLDPQNNDSVPFALDLQLEKNALRQHTLLEVGRLAGHLDLFRAFDEAFQTPDDVPFLLPLPHTSEMEASQWLRGWGLEGTDYRFMKAKNGCCVVIEAEKLPKLLPKPTPKPRMLPPAALSLGIRMGLVPPTEPPKNSLLRRLPLTGFEKNTTCMAAWMPFFSIHTLQDFDALPDRLEKYVGFLVEAGFACWDIAAWIASDTFFSTVWQGTQTDTQEAVIRYERVLASLFATKTQRPWLIPQDYEDLRNHLAARIFSLGKQYLEAKGHRVSANYRRLQTHYETVCTILTALLKEEPAFRLAFFYPAEWKPADFRAARRFAFSQLFHQEEGQIPAEMPLDAFGQTPTAWNQAQKQAFEDWLRLEQTGRPFSTIQDYLAQLEGETTAVGTDTLTGQVAVLSPLPKQEEHKPIPLYRVNWEDPYELEAFFREHPHLLDEPIPLPDGRRVFLDLEGGQNACEFPHGFVFTQIHFRSDASDPGGLTFAALQDRFKQLLLRRYFQHRGYELPLDFRPDKVFTVCPAWEAFCGYVGGQIAAYELVREQILARFIEAFISRFHRETQSQDRLRYAEVPLTSFVVPVEMAVPLSLESHLHAAAQRERASLQTRRKGRFLPGSVRERWLQDQQQQCFFENLDPQLRQPIERFFQDRLLRRVRPTIGVESENLLGNLCRGFLDTETPSWRHEGGHALGRLRAVTLLKMQRRLAVMRARGQGKILTVLQAVECLKQENDLQRFLVLVPAQTTLQYQAEILRWLQPTDAPFGAFVITPQTPKEQRWSVYANGSVKLLVVPWNLFLQDLRELENSSSTIPLESLLARHNWVFDTLFLEDPLALRQSLNDNDILRLCRYTQTLWARMCLLPQEDLHDLEEIALVLALLDPERYPWEDRSGFFARFLRLTPIVRMALKRELSVYFFGQSISLGPDTPAQRVGCYSTEPEKRQVEEWEKQMRAWQGGYERGQVDIPSMRQHWNWIRTQKEAMAVLDDLSAWNERKVAQIVGLHPQGAKLQWLLDYHRNHPQERLVVVCTTREMATMLAAELQNAGVRCAPFLQNQSDLQREKALEAFSEPYSGDKPPLWLLATDAALLGYALYVPHTLVFYDVPAQLKTYQNRYARVWGRDGGYVSKAFELVSEATQEQQRYRRLVGRKELAPMADGWEEILDETGVGLWLVERRRRRLMTS